MSIDKALQRLFKLGIDIKKVWENSSPDSGFAKQDINIGTSSYDFALIIHQSVNVPQGQTRAIDIIRNDAENNNILRLTGFVDSSTMENRGFGAQRRVKRSGSVLQFTDCVRGVVRNGIISSIIDPSLCKPVAIYIIKFMGGYCIKLGHFLQLSLTGRRYRNVYR